MARIVPESIRDLGKGFYEATVKVWNAATNKWVKKSNKSTFFPDAWDETKVLQEISDIIGKKSEKIIPSLCTSSSNAYEGIMSNGVKVIFFRWPSFQNNMSA